MDLVRRIVKDDPEALDLLDQALRNSGGRPPKTVDNVHASGTAKPDGNSRDAALRRLRKDRRIRGGGSHNATPRHPSG